MATGVWEVGVAMVAATLYISPRVAPKVADAEIVIGEIRQRAGDGVLAATQALIRTEIGLERTVPTGVVRGVGQSLRYGRL